MRALMAALLFCTAIANARSEERKEKVDLLLVLAADVSRSVDMEEYSRQQEGYASAIANPEFVRRATLGAHGKIAILYMEWSGVDEQEVIVNWTVIDRKSGMAAARSFGQKISDHYRRFWGVTAIGDALLFAKRELDNAPFEADRRVIDVSGDGTNNAGSWVEESRDRVVARGITINALVMLPAQSGNLAEEANVHTRPPGGLERYFRANVIGGENSFVLTADRFDGEGEGSFFLSLLRKLFAEISGLMPVQHAKAE